MHLSTPVSLSSTTISTLVSLYLAEFFSALFSPIVLWLVWFRQYRTPLSAFSSSVSLSTCCLWILWLRQWFSVQSSTICLLTTDLTRQACVPQRSLRSLSEAFPLCLPPLNSLKLVVLALFLCAVTTRVQWTNHLSQSCQPKRLYFLGRHCASILLN